jgi:hypothetical protein
VRNVRSEAKENQQATPMSLADALGDYVSTVNSDDQVYKLALVH